MCTNCTEERVLIRQVESLYKWNKQRWAIIKHKGGLLEVIPEQSLSLIDLEINTLVYTLKDYKNT